jgi:hypothetical protein
MKKIEVNYFINVYLLYSKEFPNTVQLCMCTCMQLINNIFSCLYFYNCITSTKLSMYNTNNSYKNIISFSFQDYKEPEKA